MIRHLPLYVAAVCLSASLGLFVEPAAGLLFAGFVFAGLWWLTLEEVDDDIPS